ncbi:MAG: hypothetical protein KJ043_20630, partial [Anaerolineae bacterium]|nr:hypothetical protein [Anaerolineae bacterium]
LKTPPMNLRYSVLPISGASADDLQARLTDLIAQLQNGSSVDAIQARAIHNYDENHIYGGGIIGKNRDELLSEALSAQKGVATAFEKGRDWESKIGSSFTAKPAQGDVALVYPGAFNAYVGMGGDLFYTLPQLIDVNAPFTDNLQELMADKLIYPRLTHAMSEEEYHSYQLHLADNLPVMMQAGSMFAWQYTQVIKALGIMPQSMFGYSMGEASMMWGADKWFSGERASYLLHTSNLFTSKVVGKKTAARHYLADMTTPDDDLWGNYVIATDPDTVRQALADEPTVFMTHINTPNQVAIAGEKVACERVLAKIGAGYVQAMPAVLHCPPTQNAHADFVRLHNLPIEHDDYIHTRFEAGKVKLYGSNGRLITATDSDAIARELAHDMVEMVDFPHLVNTVYNDGARVFIEVGAQNTCTRWIRDILRDKPHVAVATNRMGVSDSQSIARLIAKLISHRVPMNLSVL